MLQTEPVSASEPLNSGLEKLTRSGRDRLPIADSRGLYVGMLAPCQPADAPCANFALAAEPAAAQDAPSALLRLFAEQDTDTVAVVDATSHLIGVADRTLTLKLAAQLIGATMPGATIAITISRADYEIGRLAQTIELAGARILSITTSADGDPATVYVKLAQQDPYPVINALERHGYDADTYSASYALPPADDILRRNYDSLIDYLNI